MSITTLTKPSSRSERDYFALCDMCFWSATILAIRRIPYDEINCPNCSNTALSLVPLGREEAYKINHSSKRGLEIEFSRSRNLIKEAV